MLAIRAARMFDGLRLHDRSQILVAGERIADVDFTGAQPPPGYQLVDLGDATLLPGLIDTHMHLVFNASTDPAGTCRPSVTRRCSRRPAPPPGERSVRASPACVTWVTGHFSA